MGIFDGFKGGQGGIAEQQKQYEKAVERAEQDRRVKEEYARQMMGAQQGVIQGGAYHGQGLLQQQYQQAQLQAAMQQAKQAEEFDPNKLEAWTMPMSALVNLWRAKFLDEWVIVRTRELEPFWQAGFTRLNRASKFEEAPGQWVRLREDA